MASWEEPPLPRSFDSVFYGAAGGGEDLPSDDQFNRVSFLSHFEGANNGVNNAFDDGSTSNHTITANGDVTQGSFGPFARPDGEWAVSFDGDRAGSVANYLDTPAGADFELDANYTIEGWFFQTVREEGSALFELNDYRSGILFRLGDASSIYDNWYINGTDYDSPASSFPLGQWNHFAMTRDGSTNRLFANGVQIATASVSGDINSTQGKLRIGGIQHSTGQQFVGAVSNFRLIKGTALYTSNFTPSTSKLTAVTNTKLLTCQSNRFVDNSASAHTLTPYGKTAVTAFGPFLTSAVYDAAVNGASAYFDGTDDLTIPTSSDFNLSTNPFTFSFWANFSSGGTVYGRYYYPTGKREIFISCFDTGQVYVRVSETGSGYANHATASGVFVFNQWNYIVITRTIDGSNSVFKTYVNGTLSKTTTISFTTINYDSQSTYIMNYGYVAERPTGYLCDFKLVNGTATAPNSSNPTAPATNTTNTKLLLNMADGQAIDSAAQNNLTLVGTAKTSTAQKKFGTASLLLDGNSDGAILNGDSFNAGTAGDFTIELFARFVAQQDYMALVTNWANGNNDWYWGYYAANDELRFYPGPKSFSFSASNDTWYHIALVRTQGSLKCFVDGTQVGSTQSDATDVHHSPYILLGKHGNGEYFNGYMDEIRLSNFARYTSNFTAPSEPFADKGR